MNKQQETFRIEGMSCGHCVAAVRQALTSLEGVEVLQVEIGTARVNYDPAQTRRDEIVEAIEVEGYDVKA